MTVLLLGLAGGVGAVCRLLVDTAVRHRWGGRLPYGLFVVNASGSLLLGVLTGLVAFHGAPDDLRLVAGTGFCGGWTTFSTASTETVRLAREGRAGAAAGCAAGMLLTTLLAAALGLWLAG